MMNLPFYNEEEFVSLCIITEWMKSSFDNSSKI